MKTILVLILLFAAYKLLAAAGQLISVNFVLNAPVQKALPSAAKILCGGLRKSPRFPEDTARQLLTELSIPESRKEHVRDFLNEWGSTPFPIEAMSRFVLPGQYAMTTLVRACLLSLPEEEVPHELLWVLDDPEKLVDLLLWDMDEWNRTCGLEEEFQPRTFKL